MSVYLKGRLKSLEKTIQKNAAKYREKILKLEGEIEFLKRKGGSKTKKIPQKEMKDYELHNIFEYLLNK